jgi:hypothetical protein
MTIQARSSSSTIRLSWRGIVRTFTQVGDQTTYAWEDEDVNVDSGVVVVSGRTGCWYAEFYNSEGEHWSTSSSRRTPQLALNVLEPIVYG